MSEYFEIYNENNICLGMAKREMNEELGIPLDHPIEFLYELKERNSIETENISVFSTIYDGTFVVQKDEIDKIKFWNVNELETELDNDSLTPLCRKELITLFAKK